MTDDPVQDCRNLVLIHFKGNEFRARTWFQCPNPLLGYDTPDRWIMCNKAEDLRDILQRMVEQSNGSD